MLVVHVLITAVAANPNTTGGTGAAALITAIGGAIAAVLGVWRVNHKVDRIEVRGKRIEEHTEVPAPIMEGDSGLPKRNAEGEIEINGARLPLGAVVATMYADSKDRDATLRRMEADIRSITNDLLGHILTMKQRGERSDARDAAAEAGMIERRVPRKPAKRSKPPKTKRSK